MTQATNGNGQARGSGFPMPPGPLKDNILILEWLEKARLTARDGHLIIGACSAELDARLRTVHRGLVIGGMTAGYRARRVSSPVSNAAEALLTVQKYLVTAANRFEAVYMPELEAVGYAPKVNSGFVFKRHP